MALDKCAFSGALNADDVNKIMSGIYKTWNKDAFSEYVERFKLSGKKKIKDYSRGMTMKLSIAAALSHDSRLLILDEATSGLDPIVRDEILDILLDFIQDETHSVLMSSHIVSDLEKACDYIAFLHQGRLVFCEEKDELLDNLLLLIDLENTLKFNNILVFVNLKQYLSKNELIEFYKYAIYSKIQILLIDSQAYGVTLEYEKKLIIDENLDEFVI